MKSLDDNKKLDRARVWLLTVCFSVVAFAGIAAQASAGPLDEIPEDLAGALETSTSVAGLILSAGIMMSAALVLAVTKTNMMGTLSVLVVILVGLIAIEWLPYWILILIGMIAAAMFGKWMAVWFSGESQGGQ